MTLPELKERVIRLVSAGIDPDEVRFSDAYIESLIHASRAFVLRQDYLKFRRWSHEATQTFYPDYEEDFQTDVCVTRFMLPTGFIQGNSLADGLVYFGSTGKIMGANNFRRIKSRSELSDLVKHPRMSPSSGLYNGVMIEGLLVSIFSKESIKVKYPMVVAVFDNPTMLPDYNLKSDNYPLSSDMIDAMEVYIMQSTMATVLAKSPDMISSTSEPTQPIQVKR